jgi:mRNA interferase YafQ
MLTPVYTRQFERDVRRLKKRGKDFQKFKTVARTLLEARALDPLHRDHKLVGSYQDRRECHIEADWLLIYKKESDRIIFERMGTHSDLFKM